MAHHIRWHYLCGMLLQLPPFPLAYVKEAPRDTCPPLGSLSFSFPIQICRRHRRLNHLAAVVQKRQLFHLVGQHLTLCAFQSPLRWVSGMHSGEGTGGDARDVVSWPHTTKSRTISVQQSKGTACSVDCVQGVFVVPPVWSACFIFQKVSNIKQRVAELSLFPCERHSFPFSFLYWGRNLLQFTF